MLNDVTMRPRSSTIRVPREGYTRQQAQQIIDDMGGPLGNRAGRQRRASAQQAPTTTGRSRRPAGPDRVTAAAYQQPRRQQPDTYDDPQTAPGVRTGRGRAPYQQKPQRHREGKHPLLWLGLGMLVMLFLWSGLLHVGVWYITTFHDPAQYTQTAHRDQATGIDAKGHPFQARAFIDARSHVDIVVIVDGDASHARIMVGPVITQVDNPQHTATITASARGSVVTVVAAGPLVADWFTTRQPAEQWAVDIGQQPKGGK